MSKKIAVVLENCVACGSCLKVCPMTAVSVYNGIRAVVDAELCVGCGMCAKTCPAGVIIIEQQEALGNED